MSLQNHCDTLKKVLADSHSMIIDCGGEVAPKSGYKNLPDDISSIVSNNALLFSEVSEDSYRIKVPSRSEDYARIKKIGGRSFTTINLFKPIMPTGDGFYGEWENTAEDGSGTFIRRVKQYTDTSFTDFVQECDPKQVIEGDPETGEIVYYVPDEETTRQVVGITWTLNEDGTITAQGLIDYDKGLYDSEFPLISKHEIPNIRQCHVYGEGFSVYDSLNCTYYEDGSGEVDATDLYGNSYDSKVHINGEVIRLHSIEIGIYPDAYEPGYVRNINSTFKIMVSEENVPWEPWFEEIRDVKCEALRCEGENLYNGKQDIVTTEADYSKNFTVFESDIDETVTFSYTLNGTAANKATLFLITLLDGTTANIGSEPTVITVPNVKKIQRVNWCKFNGTIENIQIQYGKKATEYCPYRDPVVFPIPNEILTRDDYGISIDTEHYNYIEWRDGKCYLVKSVENITNPIVLSVGKHENGQPYAAIKATNPKANGAVLTQNYIRSSWSDKDRYIYIIGGNIIINDSRFLSVDNAQNILTKDKTVIHYELAALESIDITNAVDKNNFFKVVSGGTITAVNTRKEAVQTTIKYLIRAGKET